MTPKSSPPLWKRLDEIEGFQCLDSETLKTLISKLKNSKILKRFTGWSVFIAFPNALKLSDCISSKDSRLQIRSSPVQTRIAMAYSRDFGAFRELLCS